MMLLAENVCCAVLECKWMLSINYLCSLTFVYPVENLYHTLIQIMTVAPIYYNGKCDLEVCQLGL